MPDIVEEPQSRTNHLEIDDSEHEVPGKVGKYAMLSLKLTAINIQDSGGLLRGKIMQNARIN